MTIGVSREEFYHSTLVELRDFDEVYKNRRKIEDEQAYFSGIYMYEAVTIALGNAFRPKGKEPIPYRNKSILAEIEEKNRPLTEEEIKKHTNELFAMLGGMQQNFEASHKGGGA